MMSESGEGRSCTFRNASVLFGNLAVYRGGTLRGRIFAALVLGLFCSLAAGAQARDATVRSFDQTAINTHFFPAAGLAAGRRAPTVLVGPGWSMSGATDENGSSEELFGGVGVGTLRAAGYNVLTWDPRGFGS